MLRRTLVISIALLGACSSDPAPQGAGGRGGGRRDASAEPDAQAATADAAPRPDGPPAMQGEIAGSATYQKRAPNLMGLPQTPTPSPVAGADVELLDAADRSHVYAATRTDAAGRYRFVLSEHPDAAGKPVVVRLLARVRSGTYEITVVDGAASKVLYAVSSEPVTPAATGTTVDLDVDATPGTGRAGAFNLLAVTSRCADHVITSVGGTLGPLEVRWRFANTADTEGSTYFDIEGGLSTLNILGGEPGMPTTSDTDEFDDGVAAHEFGHFFQSERSYDSSPGGDHGGEYLMPSLAYSEGFGNYFSSECRADPIYLDTAGVGAGSMVSVSINLETESYETQQGIGSEEGVGQILWDLADGADAAASGGLTLPDADMDGVAIGSTAILRAMDAWTPGVDYPYIGRLLDDLVGAGAVDAATVARLMTAPKNQHISYPLTGEDLWPIALAAPGMASGRVDATSRPPAGSRDNPWGGYQSTRLYRFSVATARMVTIRLTITGGGDLALSLRDLADAQLGTSDGATATEEITRMLAPGSYLVEVSAVHANDSTSAASYDLSIQ